MAERTGAVTMRGQPITLVGNEVKAGDKAPDFEVVDNGLSPVRLSSYSGKIVVISSLPSLDTPVCDLETRTFNQQAANLGEDVVVLTISMDLPFAQKRWCGAFGVDHVKMVSDHREGSFGQAYGTLIKDLRIMSRAIFVLGKDNHIRHVEYVKEVGEHPNYETALAAARTAAGAASA